MLVFVEGGKPENPEKTNYKLNPHKHQAGIVPRPQPCSPPLYFVYKKSSTI